MSVNLDKTSNSLPLSRATIASGNLDILLNLVICSALSQLEHGIIAQFHEDFQIKDKSLQVVWRDQNGRFLLLTFNLVR